METLMTSSNLEQLFDGRAVMTS